VISNFIFICYVAISKNPVMPDFNISLTHSHYFFELFYIAPWIGVFIWEISNFPSFRCVYLTVMSEVCFLTFSKTIKCFSWFQFIWFHWIVKFYISPNLKWQISWSHIKKLKSIKLSRLDKKISCWLIFTQFISEYQGILFGWLPSISYWKYHQSLKNFNI